MIVDDTHVEYFNNQLFVHICTFKYRGESVYYFANLKDQLLCTKDNGVYEIITDPYKYSLYKNVFGLVNPLGKNKIAEAISDSAIKEKIDHIRRVIRLGSAYAKKYEEEHARLDLDEENKYKEELKEVFGEMKAKMGLNIDLDQSSKMVDNLKYFKLPDNSRIAGLAEEDRKIHLAESARKDDPYSKRVRVHEGIHAKTGKRLRAYHSTIGSGLMEAETENLANDYMGGIGSFNRYIRGADEKARMQAFNFPIETTYKEGVCILKQMEVALGKKAHNSIINGDMSFEKDFIKQYGLITFIKIVSSVNMMKNMSLYNGNYVPKLMETLNRTQNYLLKRVFEKDFAKVQNPQDAQKLLKKLKAFDLVRIRDYKENDEHKLEEDQTYANYYKDMITRTKEKLMHLGYTEQEIEPTIVGLDYQKQRFDTAERTPEDNRFAALCYSAFMIRQGVELNPQNCEFVRGVNIDGMQSFFIINNGKVLTDRRVRDPEKQTVISEVEEIDYETAMKEFEEEGITLTRLAVEPLEVINQARKNVEESLKKEAELKKLNEAKEKPQEEQSMVPLKKQSIIQKMINRIKEAFKPRKREDDGLQKVAAEEKNKEEEKHSWDLKNWGMTKEDLNKREQGLAQKRSVEVQKQSKTKDEGPEL